MTPATVIFNETGAAVSVRRRQCLTDGSGALEIVLDAVNRAQ